MSQALTLNQIALNHPAYYPELIENIKLEKLSHEELVSLNLLEILEEKYQELDKTSKDAIIMLLIENGIELEL